MCLAYKKYYKNIDPDIVNSNISSRQQATSTSDNSYDVRYSSLIGLNSCSSLYNDISNESRRIAITRWRLSNHKLRVETGRYTRPKTPRGERTCSICQVIEDETHAIFLCPIYRSIRLKYSSVFTRYTSVREILNPLNADDVYKIGSFIIELEEFREENGFNIT